MADKKEAKVSPRKKPVGSIMMKKMIKGPKPDIKYSPSSYLAEKSLSTEEKLAQTREMYSPQIIEFLDITENATFKSSSVDCDQALFQPFPSEIIFQHFEKKKTYEFPLILRNLDKVARHVKVTQKESSYFSVCCSKPSGQKVAPGMEIVYNISFTPDDEKDFHHELICITEREKFRIPIRAIGPRALLDFPDEIYFTSAPVKYKSTKSVFVRNIGKRKSKIELKTEEPFSVSPSTFTLQPQHSIQIEVGFNPTLIGDHSKELEIQYDTEECVYTQLHGASVNVNVRLDKSSLLMEDTFISLSSQRVVTLFNRSNIPVHFEWKSMATEEEEQYQRDQYTQQLMEEESTSKDTFMERCLHNPAVRDRFPILTHTYHNKKKNVSNQKFFFTDQAFSIDPMEGDIWPNSQAEVTITFQPSKAIHYSAVAFCNVTGRENRLPLKFKGSGKGPKLKFSYNELDIQSVFVNSAHAYEVVLQNNGDIEASYSLRPSSTLFGPKFSFTPSSGHLLPDGLQVIQISFSSSTLGKFEEEFIWDIDKSPDQLHLRISGSVIGPTFQFNVSDIDFSDISYGFPVSKDVTLVNLSEVVMTYSLHVPSNDKHQTQVGTRKDSNEEFIVHPKADTLPPGIPQTIKITFTPRHVKEYATHLVMDIAEVGSDVFSLPIKANSIVPHVTVSPISLDYGRCFLNYPYTTNLVMYNTSMLPGQYEMMKMPNDSPILCTTTMSKGVIEGQQSLNIPLTIKALAIGHITVNCAFRILGSTSPPIQVEIHCTGEGPVISVIPAQLDWGPSPVLTPIDRKLLLSNESEIQAEFNTAFMRENSVFSIEPLAGIVPAREKMVLTITAFLDDSTSFTDKLTIHVKESVAHSVSLMAEGKGTTIVSVPSMYPRIELGTHFSCHQCIKEFILTNKGRRSQALSWMTEGFSMAKLKKAEREKATRDMKDVGNKSSSKFDSQALKKPMFQVTPDKFILAPSQSEKVTITGYSDIPQSVTERLICTSVIGYNPHKEKIMGIEVIGHFITPFLQFSTKELTFITRQLPGSELVKHYQDIVISRESPLPLNVQMTCNHPFSMILGPDGKQCYALELSLVSFEEVTITVVYDSTYCKDRISRIENKCIEISYKEHPQKDYINLVAEICFPNIGFETEQVDFGCILNDTEDIRMFKMTNMSPLEVHYSWSFLKRPPVKRIDPVHDDEGVDMPSDVCETDSLEEGEGSTPSIDEPMGAVTVTITSPSPIKDPNIKKIAENEIGDNDDLPLALSQSLPPSESSSESSLPTASQDEEQQEDTKSNLRPRKKDPWELIDDPFVPIGIEQVFDILPLYGTLMPGETQEVQVTFYGHANISTEVVAVCKVEGGPSYEVLIRGQASTIEYKIDNKKISLGDVPYDEICEAEIVLSNIGKVSFDYSVVNEKDYINCDQILPGRPVVQPPSGRMNALESQKLQIKYLPGVPRPFKKSLQIQVAHFECNVVTLVGQGYYPRISFSLPRPIVQEPSKSLEKIKSSLKSRKPSKKKQQFSMVEMELEAERMAIDSYVEEKGLKYVNNVKTTKSKRPVLPEYLLDFGYVVSRLTVSKRVLLTNIGLRSVSLFASISSLTNTGFTTTLSNKIKDLPPGEAVDFTVQFDPVSVNGTLGYTETVLPIQLMNGPAYPLKLAANVTLPTMTVSSTHLDYGTVQCGQCKIITLRLYNTQLVKCQWKAITEKPPKKIPKHTPLHIRKKIKEKPPPTYFEVDPANGILLPEQKADIQIKFMPSDEMTYNDQIPFVVNQNPDVNIIIQVTGKGSEPQIIFDRTMVEFDPVLPFSEGSEAEVTITNPMDYPLEIYSLEFDNQYLDEEDMLRWVRGYDIKHRLFLPPIQIGESLPFEIKDAYTKRHSATPLEDSAQVAESKSSSVPPDEGLPSNPSLEHVESSQVVVDGNGQPGLPSVHPNLAELQSRIPSSTVLLPQAIGMGVSSTSVLSHGTVKASFSDPSLEDLEITPVAACIARYLGIDLSPEGALAEHRKGIAIIFYGAPLSGKTVQANRLSQKYSASIIVVEDLIIDVISSGSTPAGIKARELCIEATMNTIQKEFVQPIESESPLSSKASMAGGKKANRVNAGNITGMPPKSTNTSTEEEVKKDTPEPFMVNPLLDTPYAAPGDHLIPVKLPEELIVEIISDRIQQIDCRKGIIFDGLKCSFSSDQLMTTALILRALGDRKHIFFANLDLDRDELKDRVAAMEIEKQKKKEEERLLEEEEEKQIQALLDISEDEYEQLDPEEQKKIDLIRQQRYLERKRLKQAEREAQAKKERERREEEQRLLEEEKSKAKKGRGGAGKPTIHQVTDQKNSPGHSRPDSVTSNQLRQASLVNPSAASISSGATDSASGRKTSKFPHGEKESGKKEDNLNMRFLNYKLMYESIKSMLNDWDRVKGAARPKKSSPPQEMPEQRKVSTTPKKKGRKSQTKSDLSPKNSSSSQSQQNVPLSTTEQEEIDSSSREGLGIPFISVQAATLSIDEVTDTICSNGLPAPEEILHSMGIYEEESPIPDPVTFQVHPYPLKRRQIPLAKLERFTFISTGPDDPNAEQEVKVSPEPVIMEEPEPSPAESATTTRLKHSGSIKLLKEDQGQRRRSTSKLSGKGGKSTPSPQHQEEVPIIEEHPIQESPDPPTPKKIINFRWIIPPKEERKIKLLFLSEEEGQFDQVMNFEIMGTKRHYQLFCRGVCQFPTICKDPRIVFPNRMKSMKKNEIIHKQYIMDREGYYFGPLHCGKPREKYREGRYMENMESIIISNPTYMKSDITICFRHDTSASTFLFEPPNMVLEPGESQLLNVWAYPKAAGEFQDAVVCSIKSNPNPVVFPITATGVEPELRLDRKHLDFGKVLLHRRESRVLHLRNNTLLPVAWKLNGLETLGDEFTFSQEQGIVQPKTEFPLNINFRAAKAISYSKKAFKIEVSDVEQIIGLINVEHVQLAAEAYDVALDISFPKGADGGLEFGVLRVHEEQKQVMSLKNRGKYEIGYNFRFDMDPSGVDYSKWFVLNPTSSVLYAGEKSQAVGIIFKPDRELIIKDETLLHCQVIDTHLGQHGEVIANIPIRFNARSVYSRYTVSPCNDVNFGCMVITSRKCNSFTISNNGDYEFRYCVSKRISTEVQKARQTNLNLTTQPASSRLKRDASTASRSSSVVAKTLAPKHKDTGSLRYEVMGGSSQRLVMGVFSISPAYGIIGPGMSQSINIECVAERSGKHEELLSIEVSDANRKNMPIKYKVCAEVLIPGINTSDLTAIFEEHRICKELGVLGQHQFHEDKCVGVFGEIEKRFLFKSVTIGQLSKARFRILNTNKIPCDVLIGITKAAPLSKTKGIPDVFEVEPNKASIGPHSHVYATVTFKPLAIQVYNALFEATIDGPSQARGKGLSFELQGEGNLPQVSVLKPQSISSEHGHYMLLFRRLLLGEKEVQSIVIGNTGTVSAGVTIHLENHEQQQQQQQEETEDNEEAVFGILYSDVDESGDDCVYTSLPLSFEVPLQGKKELTVSFRPQSIRTYKKKLVIDVEGNQFETMTVSLIGEGYQDDIVVHNIRGPSGSIDTIPELAGDVEVARTNHLYFGGCPVSDGRSLTFTLTNYSENDYIRFKWPSVAGMLTFTPSVGHLYPGSSKDIIATLMSTKAKICKNQKIVGKYWEIKYTKPAIEQQRSEWDDRVRTVKWINTPYTKKADDSTGPTPPAKKKVIETEPEPSHEIIGSDAGYDIDLHYSAIVSTAEVECPTKAISFKDTYVLQTRVFKLPLKNVGLINSSYHWYLIDGSGSSSVDDVSRSSISTSKSESDTNRGSSDYGSGLSSQLENVNVLIEPQQGEIPPGGEQIITFKFSPVTILEFTHTFRCQVSNSSPGSTPIDVTVVGSSMLPYCHFDLPESDYLANRRPSNTKSVMLLNSGAAGSIDPATKVIEFTSTGTGHRISRSFFITNPTELNYEFVWTCQDTPSSATTMPIFTCLTPKGQVIGGKKFQITFEYFSSRKQLTESLWHFSIPSLSLTIPFLLVGHTFEPKVHIDRAYLNFKATLIGSTVKETIYLINTEEKAYNFKFNERTCQCENPNAKLTVSPMSGIIGPNQKLAVDISFSAPEPREFIFNLHCNVKSKATPLSINVKAVGHYVDVGASITNSKGEETMLTSKEGGGTIKKVDFGKILVNERALWQLSIYNYCTFQLHYQLVLSDGCNKKGGVQEKLLAVSPLEGKIKPQNKAVCEVMFSPASTAVMKNCEVLIKITGGPTIPIIFNGAGVEPKASFSFLEHDFGPKLLLQHDMSNTATLRISNNEKTDLNINCIYSVSDGAIEPLNFEPGLLEHGDSMDVDFAFRPTKAMKYKEVFEFEINGVCKKKVTLKGEGASIKVEVVDPSQRIVNLGAIGVKEKSCKQVRLINRSLLAVTFAVNIIPSTQVPVLHQEKVLSVCLCPKKGQPMKEVTLKPKEEIDVEVTFHPPSRVPQFSEEVIMEAYGQSQPLFVMKGSCHGMEISLDNNHVPFGAVVKSSQCSRRILLMNTGDIGARFKWDVEKFSPDFSISPSEGYILSGMEVPFTITFHPQTLNQDIRYDNLTCNIEGTSPLKLTLTGMCIDQTPMKEVLHFTTTVRCHETRQITVHNKTAVPWVLHPIINGEHWSGPMSFNVPAGGAAHYELTYRPLLMTHDTHKHTGSVFFPLPDGTGILQNLSGTADPPKNSGSLTKEIPCKTSHTELLTVENWLRQPQRFRAFVENVRPERLDHSVNLYGNEYIDVPALGKKNYQLHFYSFKEGSYLSKVTFQNEVTGEYQFFHVHFKATAPGIMSSVELTTPVRQGVSHTITIDNPFQTPVKMSTSVNCADITVPTDFLIGGESQGKCTFEYLPLKVGESTGKLILQSHELGAYNYELVLKATPPAPERMVYFNTPLGSSQTLPCHFSNYARGRTEYICKVDDQDFHVERSVTVAATDASIDVTFEPSTLGDSKVTLSITSSSGGDYLIPLHGHCLPPRPQGPFNIKTGGSISIPFRNVFHQPKQFNFTVDNPLFVVKTADTLKPRKVYNILVQFDKGTEHTGGSSSGSSKSKQSDVPIKLGKLVVTCLQSANRQNRGNEGFQWTYYLRGLPP